MSAERPRGRQDRLTRTASRTAATAPVDQAVGGAVADRIAAYGTRYAEKGDGRLFSEGDGHTPVLAAMMDTLRGSATSGRRTTRNRVVVEAGAGPGDQAVHLATNLPRVRVVAVEPNADTSGIHERVAASRNGFGHRSGVDVVEADVNAYLAGVRPGTVDAVHAHSLVHLWGPEGRAAFYDAAHTALADGGTIAVSLKAEGDAQQQRAKPVEREKDPAGNYGQDPVYSNIVRLFVGNPAAIAEELRRAGFDVVDVHRWSETGYDFAGEDGKFVGFVGRKVGKEA